MSLEVHVRFCEGVGGKFPGATRLLALPNSLQLENGKVTLNGSFALVGEGIYQIRVNGGEEAQVVTSDDLAFGVSFQNGSFTPWKDSPKRLYAYIPPKAQELNIFMRSGKMRIADENGSEIWNSEDGKGQKINVENHETIWAFDFASENYEFRA